VDAAGQSHAAWRQLGYEWEQVREAWRDTTGDYFARRFWEPVERETADCQRALEMLLDTLRAAREAAAP